MEGQERPFMTTGDIVKLAQVHPNTVAMWRQTGKIRPVDRVGPAFLYLRDDVMLFLKKRDKKIKNRKKK